MMKNTAIWITALLSLSTVVSVVGESIAQPSYTDITTSSGIRYSGFGGRSWDVAIGDINGDGINDLYCMAHLQGRDAKYSILYRSNSSLGLSDITGSAFGSITATGGGQGVLYLDLDADGDLDLITGSNDGVGCVLKNQGNGTFGWYEDMPGYYGTFHAREFSGGDMDGDGDLDLVIGVHHLNMKIATNNGAGVFDVGQLSWTGSETPCGATLPIVADMDNDGDLDIVSQFMSAYGTCAVPRNITCDFWRNNGSGTFEWVSDTNGLTNGEEEGVLLVGDFDNDADLDIIQIVYATLGVNGQNRYYVNDGTGHFTDQASSRGISGNSPFTDWWSKAITGDFDNDGDLDIHFRNSIWVNNGSGSFSVTSVSGISGRISGAGDLDGDGDLDLAGARAYWEVAGDGFWVWRNNTNNNGWLLVSADDGPLNPFGVGAKVYVYDGTALLGYRQVIAASAMQQPLDQHFGLGSSSVVRVEVLFPDGTLTIRDNVSAGQKIIVTKSSNPIPPSMPAGLAASGTDVGCADLAWDTPAFSDRVSEYMLAWGPSPGTYTDSTVVPMSSVTSQAGTSSYRQCLPSDGTYCFVLRAHNAYDLWSAYSTASCADVTSDSTSLQPQPLTGFGASNGNNGCADLSWSTPPTNDLIIEYLLSWGTSSGVYPNSLLINYQAAMSLPPTVVLGWSGVDPDIITKQPTKVRYLLKEAVLRRPGEEDYWINTEY